MKVEDALSLCGDAAIATRASNTARVYTNGLQLFTEYLESLDVFPASPVAEVSMEHFIRFPAWLAHRGYSKKTIGVYLAGTKFLLDWLVINGHLQPDYSESLRYEMAVKQVKQRKETRLPRTPEKGALEKIVAVLEAQDIPDTGRDRLVALRNQALIWFLITSGCRNNEVVQLKVKDIDLTGHRALVLGKGNKERRVYFNSRAAEALERYWASRGFREKTHPAFARHDRAVGKKIRGLTTASVRNIVDALTLAAGLDKGSFTPHYFRHAFAIRMLRATHDLALVQDLLGHSSPASTRVYAKIYPEELERAHREVWEAPPRSDDKITKSE